NNFNYPVIASDRNPASPFRDRLYAAWHDRTSGEIFFSSSMNQGVTWSVPLQLSNSAVEGFVDSPEISVAQNGDVYLAYHSQPGGIFPTSGVDGQTFVLRSTDGGVSFPAAQKT